MTNHFTRHSIILGPSRKNDPQMIEGQLKTASYAGTLVHLDETDGLKLAQSAAGHKGQLAILMPNTLFGGDIRDQIAVDSWAVAVMVEDDVDYAAWIKIADTNEVKAGTLLKHGAAGILEKDDSKTAPVFVLREPAKVSTANDLMLAKVRKI